MLTFKGREWEHSGNHFNLVGTKVRVYQWNSGKNANFMIEILGKRPFEKNTITVPGKGQEAREKAIIMAHKLASKI